MVTILVLVGLYIVVAGFHTGFFAGGGKLFWR